MTTLRSDALVVFGATGDLAYKQIFPALQALVRHGRLDVPIIGVAKSGWNLDQFKARAKDSLEQHGRSDPSADAKLFSLLQYIDGDYADAATFQRLRELLGPAQHPLYYLAIPPSLFATVAAGLSRADCVKEARVVVEKPFGRDLASAQALNRTLHQYFPEPSIFRIDHFLGKEAVQNLIYFRFANSLMEAAWNYRHIESVQITMAENFGVSGRGKFYEEAGAIRDVVQNHLLEVVACLAVECPSGVDHGAKCDERDRLLQSVRTLTPADVVRGQFRGYRNEPGVAADSQVETFAALRFHIDNERWDGVPFYVRTGKRLAVTATEVLVRFKKSSRTVLTDSGSPNDSYCRFRLDPKMVIALGARVKKPGPGMTGENVELIAHQQPAELMEPYERLLGDAAAGDSTLFARQDSVEAAWRVVDPILGNATPLYEYDPNSWGPTEVEAQLKPCGGWYNPKAE
ncbi:MAG: glucose-6-phosphate dehydrogenase [Pirellula sp.]|nr:glucose-6-phosphate dehydrogenase [Pirellula sp.]